MARELKFRLSSADRIVWPAPPKSGSQAKILVTVDSPGHLFCQILKFGLRKESLPIFLYLENAIAKTQKNKKQKKLKNMSQTMAAKSDIAFFVSQP